MALQAQYANPWTAPVTSPRAATNGDEASVMPMLTRPPMVGGPATPPGGVPALPPHRRLPRVGASSSVGVYWVGAHGGAGVDTLSRLVIGSGTLGRAWPLVPRGVAPAVLVARTHYAGLQALRDAIKDWAWRDPETGLASLPRVGLIGVALIRDTSEKKLPRQLRDLAEHVTGGATQVGAVLWELPWVEAWRLGQPPHLHGAPQPYKDMADDLDDLIPALSGDQSPTDPPGGHL